jgi:hypothetical protein
MRVHWTRVTAVGSRAPAGREGHTASLSSGKVYTFGGLENGARVAKLESFDLQRRRWKDENHAQVVRFSDVFRRAFSLSSLLLPSPPSLPSALFDLSRSAASLSLQGGRRDVGGRERDDERS